MNVEAIGAGATVRFQIPGRYFRLVETTGPVTVVFFRNGSEIAESVSVEAGYAESFLSSGAGFEFVEIYSATAQTIKFAVRVESTLSYDRAVGNVDVKNINPTSWMQANRSISTSFATVLSTRKRSYLMIQNRHVSQDLYIFFGESGGTTSTAIVLKAGESLEISGIGCPEIAVRMYCPIAHSEVVTVEGIV